MIEGMVINNFQRDPHAQGRGHEHSLVSPVGPPPDKIGYWYEMKANEKTRIEQLKAETGLIYAAEFKIGRPELC